MKVRKTLILAIVTLFSALFVGCTTEVDLEDYVEVSAIGYDGYGQAVVNIDYDKLNEDYSGKLDFTESMTDMALASGESKAEFLFNECVDWVISQDTGLSNGDKITLEFSCKDSEALDYFNVEFEKDTISYKVKDLEPISDLDPFEHITATFEGIDSIGSASFSKDSEDFMNCIYFAVEDNTYNLSNGDTLTVSVEADEYLTSKYGYKLSATEKEYTVSGLTEPEEIDPFEGFSLIYSGISGIGYAEASYDGTYDFISSWNFSLDKTSNLSNGDTVSVTASIDEESALYNGYKVTNSEKSFTVSGLTEPEVWDPFEDMHITFYGISPFIYISCEYDGDSTYTIDKVDNLKNGDKVTISVEVDEDYLLRQGYVVSSLTKEYAVEGDGAYVSDFAEVDESMLEEMQDEAAYMIDDYADNNDVGITDITDVEYLGSIFKVLKDEGEGDAYNYVYLIYKASIDSKDEAIDSREMTYPVLFSNVYINNSGQYGYDSCSIKGFSSVGRTAYLLGYDDGGLCYGELSSIGSENYDITCDDTGLKDLRDSFAATDKAVSLNHADGEDVLPTLPSKSMTVGADEHEDSISPDEAVVETYSGNMSFEDQVDEYYFVAEESGNYRIDFSDMKNGLCIDMSIYDSSDYRVGYMYCNSGDGKSLELTAGEVYKVDLTQYRDYGSYTMKIWHQKSYVDVTSMAKVKDSIEFVDQKNRYSFDAPVNGRYRIEFADMKNGVTLRMDIYDSMDNTVESMYCRNGNGREVDLTEGETYRIVIRQSTDIGDYSMIINYPNVISDVTDYSDIKDEIRYEDQVNKYTFVAPLDGQYRLSTFDMKNGLCLDISVYDSMDNKVGSSYCRNDGGLTVNLTGDETYRIVIKQSTDVGSYTLHLGYPKPSFKLSFGSTVSDHMEFTDQVNRYTYTAVRDGQATFTLSGMPDGMELQIVMVDSEGYKKINKSYLENGDTITSDDLNQFETYDMYVYMYYGLGDYSITAK